MRRLLVAMTLLGGVSSCVPLRSDDPYDRVGGVRTYSTRPTPPAQPGWTNSTGRQVAPAEPADPTADASATGSAQRSVAAKVNSAPQPGTPLPAPPRPGTDPGGYAWAAVGADGTVKSGPGAPPRNATGVPLSGPELESPASTQEAAAPALVPPLAELPRASVTEVIRPDKSIQLASATMIEKHPDGPGIETRSSNLGALPTILSGSAATSAMTTPPGPDAGSSGPALPGTEPEQPATPPPSAPSAPSAPQSSGPPTTPVLRVVNSKRITLNFELKEPSQNLAGVDLWCTRDMRTWKKMDAVRSSASSYSFEVKDDGLYGFTMIARNSTSPPVSPRGGDLPQVWVTVDATLPAVQLAGVELSLTSKSPALVVRWTAQDKNFNKRPITISYAENVDGPWTQLAADVENTGRHELPLTASLPKRLFVRVEAHDMAGNVGRAQSTGPIRMELPWANNTPAPKPAPEPAQVLPPPPSPDIARPPQVAIIDVEAK